jgi:signal transduction histidine kinase
MATLNFKTNIQLKSIIGKDLINDDNIAILELVKNSFDANAKRVDIIFKNLANNDDSTVEVFSNNTSRLIIMDDGLGMNLEEIENKWLNIAYSEKKSNVRQHNRLMAGAKGVGRFSCDRLGEYLNLYSKKNNSETYTLLKIDWKKFEIDDDKKEIQSVKLEYEILTETELEKRGIQKFNQGVLLEIIKLRSFWVYELRESNGRNAGWDIEKFTTLKKYLEKLINPNQAFEKNDFGVFLDAPEFIESNKLLPNHRKFIGKIENTIFEKLDFQSTSIESSIIEDGKIIYTELKDKGQTIFWIKERNDFYPLIKNTKIFLYYLNPYAKAFFTKQTGIRSVDYGSIFLFINGFRIPPYGDVGNDWLGIDQRKAQGFARFIGLREFVGRIEILDANNDFQIISSREGVVKNENYLALVNQEGNKSFFFRTLRKLEKYVVDGLDWDSIPEEDKNRINEIEKKIISGETKEEDLIFREDEISKKRRVYNSINSIIGARAENVIELYINEDLILTKINAERESSEREFEQLINDFENKKIDGDILARIIQKKAEQNRDLEKQLSDFTKYTTTEATTKAILDIQAYKDRLAEQGKIIESLKTQLEKVEKEKEKEKVEKEKAKSEVEEVKKELTETKSQNLFLKSIKSQEFDDVLNLMHHIGISTGTIQNYIKGAIYKLENNLPFESGELKEVFSKLNYELNKIYSISKFATKANFKVETKDTILDIVSFIEQYLINIIKPFLPKKISLIVYDHKIVDFKTKFKPIELIIILDNLINNSKKAINAKEKSIEKSIETFNGKIEVTFKVINPLKIQISFKDNGIGIKDTIKDKIFDYGFTTTEGSGLGLTHIKELITKIGGTIELNKTFNQGAEFLITINKN